MCALNDNNDKDNKENKFLQKKSNTGKSSRKKH